MSVHKEKSNNTYFVAYITNGKRTKKRGFKTKLEAQQWEVDFQQRKKDTEAGVYITFNDVYNEWISNSPNKKTSIYRNKLAISKWIIPYFGDKNIFTITPLECLKWKNMLDKEGLALAYKKSLLSRLHSIFEHAINFYGLKENPTTKLPKFKSDEEPKEMQFFTREEFDRFIDYFKDDILWYAFFSTLYWTGARKGEILALKWSSIEGNIMHITKTCSSKNGSGTWELTTPKTAGSVRDIALPPILLDTLNKLWEYALKFEATKDDFIFFVARPLPDETIKRKKDKACLATGVKQIRIHDFRHSHASFLINQGASVLLVSKRLGHTNVKQTLQTYSHLFPNEEKELLKYMQ